MKLTEFEAKVDAKVKERFLESVPRYYEHTLQVVDNMKSIMARTTQTLTLLIAVAYLHDIGYSVPYGDDYAGNITEQSVKIKVHSEAEARIAKEILEELGTESPLVKRVAYLVSVHHREDIEDEELKLLLKADKV
ncbi:MAG: HD domain-containing protein [Planctomycetota bacterium]